MRPRRRQHLQRCRSLGETTDAVGGPDRLGRLGMLGPVSGSERHLQPPALDGWPTAPLRQRPEPARMGIESVGHFAPPSSADNMARAVLAHGLR